MYANQHGNPIFFFFFSFFLKVKWLEQVYQQPKGCDSEHLLLCHGPSMAILSLFIYVLHVGDADQQGFESNEAL